MDLKSTLLELFLKYAAPPLFTAIAGLGVVLLMRLQKKLAAEEKQTVWTSLANRTTHFVEVVVRDLQATLRPEIEQAVADGVVTADEFKSLRKVAIERVKVMLGEHGLKELGAFVGEGAVDSYLGSLVESVLPSVKLAEKALEKPPAPFLPIPPPA